VQDYKVYGYVTNTGVRFVLVVDDNDSKDDRCCVRASCVFVSSAALAAAFV